MGLFLLVSLNVSIPIPELVIIGPQQQEQIAVLEVILGHPLLGKEGKEYTFIITSHSIYIYNSLYPFSLSIREYLFVEFYASRPIFFNLINNPNQKEPQVTFLRDSFLETKYNNNKQVVLPDIAHELKRRNVKTATPIYIQYEYNRVFNSLFIVAPSITETSPNANSNNNSKSSGDSNSNNNNNNNNNEAERKLIRELTASRERVVVYVEDTDSSFEVLRNLVRQQIDPKLDKTIVVSTDFGGYLQSEGLTMRDLKKVPNQSDLSI